jgi:hypothetical protein
MRNIPRPFPFLYLSPLKQLTELHFYASDGTVSDIKQHLCKYVETIMVSERYNLDTHSENTISIDINRLLLLDATQRKQSTYPVYLQRLTCKSIMQFRKMIVFYSSNGRKHINTVSGKYIVLIVEASGTQ